jgi:TolB-like protein/predicted Ser/Thr protein kinase
MIDPVPDDDELASAPTQLPASTQPSLPSASTTSMPPPSVIADRYEILGLLGMGGMGSVYRAHDRTLDEVVALKLVRAELLDTPGVRERFVREVKLARRVTSPHVVRTFDLGQHGDDHFLTMEYIDGRSLAQCIDDGPLAIEEVVRIARGVATGMAAAHAVGVLHRDLKPDNVLIARSGRIAITDFGIAIASTSPTHTAERFAGTPAYMAPEQVQRGASIGAHTDVYAFGAIAFEMLTGDRPFVGSDPIQVAIARLHEPAPDPRAKRAVPDALAELVLRCMARAPGDRFADGVALAAALARDYASPAREVGGALPHVVPTRSSRSVAILPLRASDDLAELADGLGEEIVDALSQTRALRVRPLVSVRKGAGADADPRELGRTLGVDVVVDGSIRRRGDQVRIAARAIGIADGFLLWASHFDARPDALLAASDDVVRAIASALTVEVEVPARTAIDPRATELYLSAKARLRAGWLAALYEPIIADLERAHALAPDDAAIVATLATAYARSSFFDGSDAYLAKARQLSERASTAAPALGEAWFARGVAMLYSTDTAEAAGAFARALVRTPGFAMAQALLGGIMLEAGQLDSALKHLEAAESLDPFGLAHIDLPRAYVYAGRWDDAVREYERARAQPRFANRAFDDIMLARLRMWRGELSELVPTMPPTTPRHVALYTEIAANIHRTGRFEQAERKTMGELALAASPRMRASRAQFMSEFLLFVGDHDEALAWVARSVDSGLQDHMWLEHCPLLDPLRDRAEFRAAAARVADRARAVVTAVTAAVA